MVIPETCVGKYLTVRELKAILNDWPDERADGTPTEVWIETGLMLSSQAVNYCPLTLRDGVADLLLESNAFKNNED